MRSLVGDLGYRFVWQLVRVLLAIGDLYDGRRRVIPAASDSFRHGSTIGLFVRRGRGTNKEDVCLHCCLPMPLSLLLLCLPKRPLVPDTCYS